MNNVLSKQQTDAVLAILAEQLSVSLDQLTPEARIEADLGADSLAMIEIMMAVEERFQICVADEEVGEVSTVGDLLQALAKVMATSESRVS
jgi:acyl carrier protein